MWGLLVIVEGGLVNTLGKRNSFMYGGYVCDDATMLYYLQTADLKRRKI